MQAAPSVSGSPKYLLRAEGLVVLGLVVVLFGAAATPTASFAQASYGRNTLNWNREYAILSYR